MRSISPSVRGATRLNRRRLESSRTTVNSPLPRLFASSIRLFPRFLAPSRLGGKGYLADVGMRCSASVRVDLLIGADDLTCPLLRLVFSAQRSEEHTSELQSLMRSSYAVFCLKKKKTTHLCKLAMTQSTAQ